LFENVTSTTKLCISISSDPGSIGFNLHNKGYSLLGLDYLYLPLKTLVLSSAISAVRNFDIKGCSVSMPFKESVLQFLDDVDENVSEIGSVNTILNSDNQLIGYNTDCYSAKKVVSRLKQKRVEQVLIIGSGGLARVFLNELQNRNFNKIYYTSRARKDFFENSAQFIPWDNRDSHSYEAVINATPLGMKHLAHAKPIDLDKQEDIQLVVDAVSSPINTYLVEFSKKFKIEYVSGAELAFEQFLKQFEIYTSKQLDREEILKYYIGLTGAKFA
jgi:shikimate dehydrogenase